MLSLDRCAKGSIFLSLQHETNVNIAFGKRVAELRKNAGYSQEQFAFKCDVDRTYIGTIERGEKSPTLNTIVKIANALGITKSELFNY